MSHIEPLVWDHFFQCTVTISNSGRETSLRRYLYFCEGGISWLVKSEPLLLRTFFYLFIFMNCLIDQLVAFLGSNLILRQLCLICT